jgi:RNA polymerase sigma-70 factor, ECF subfamily
MESGRLHEMTTSRSVAAEVELVARTARGDLHAFETLYQGYYHRLQRFLERITRQRPQLVEELLNDTMLVVWRKSATFNDTSKVSTWIFAIAYRKSLKALKRLDEPPQVLPDDDSVATVPDAEDELQQQQLHALLSRVMGGLSAQHRAVIELTYFNGFSYPEIAQIMDCPVDTVKTRMFHARRRLKYLLAGHLEEGAW